MRGLDGPHTPSPHLRPKRQSISPSPRATPETWRPIASVMKQLSRPGYRGAKKYWKPRKWNSHRQRLVIALISNQQRIMVTYERRRISRGAIAAPPRGEPPFDMRGQGFPGRLTCTKSKSRTGSQQHPYQAALPRPLLQPRRVSEPLGGGADRGVQRHQHRPDRRSSAPWPDLASCRRTPHKPAPISPALRTADIPLQGLSQLPRTRPFHHGKRRQSGQPVGEIAEKACPCRPLLGRRFHGS